MTIARANAKPVAVIDTHDLLQRMAACLDAARDIIEQAADHTDDFADWLAEADQLLLEHRDFTRLPTGGIYKRRHHEPQP